MSEVLLAFCYTDYYSFISGCFYVIHENFEQIVPIFVMFKSQSRAVINLLHLFAILKGLNSLKDIIQSGYEREFVKTR